MQPPADPALGELLARGARRTGVALAPGQAERLAAYAAEVVRWGRRINLTGAQSAAEFAMDHVIDSVSILPLLGIEPGQTWADVGSGAGVPGIPLAVLTPSARWLLVEPRAKRWAFLVHVVHLLGLERVEVMRARTEDAPIAPGSLDGVVSRALGAPALACHPWVRPGGLLALLAGPDRSRWPADPGPPLTALPPDRVGGTPGTRYLLRFRKAGPGQT